MSKKKNNWVRYSKIKETVTIEMVLDHYGVKVTKKGQGYYGCCPIHKGSNPKQFSVSKEKNIWNCFGNCQTGGNVLDLVAMIEFGNKDSDSIRKSALLIQDWFNLSSNKPATKKDKTTQAKSPKNEKQKKNAPLSFTFKHLKEDHPWFEEHRIRSDTIKHFGLGLQENGKTIPGRIAIPIHNEQNELVAYCGRAVNNEQIEDEGKYKQPGNFYKSLVLYNLNRQARGQKIFFVVESFLSVWKMWQAGIENVVSPMGSSISGEQKQLLISYFGERQGGLILIFDPDTAGINGTKKALYELSDQFFLKRIDAKEKIHKLPEEEIWKMIFR